MNAPTHIAQTPHAPFPTFGKRLKRLRVASGFKQDALAAALGVNQATVSRWEQGAQVPDGAVQHRAFACLGARRGDDAALKRLVETTSDCVHLVDEASHVCLAYSKARAADWRSTDRELLGTSLWRFATDEIRAAEAQLEAEGWWDEPMPAPKYLKTSQADFAELTINEGWMLWERLYLADGTPARLVTGLRGHG
ncbi:MAG: helix-turn-helix transcriptional regulator [Devosiaceae bacterium]|nr:helix-turn-helix transcriptional regulator [Devosiaceae bacterium MH13]